MFAQFERRRRIEGGADWVLQFFRTVCWELRILRDARERHVAMAEAYEALICEHGSRSLSTMSGGPVAVKKARNLDWRQVHMENKIEELDELIAKYEREFAGPLRDELAGRDAGVKIFVLDSKESLPVCLAGKGNYHCLSGTDVQRVDAFIQILPVDGGTKLAMLGPMSLDTSFIHSYIKMFLEDHGLLPMVEAWMLNGTDHWFLRPSVWDALSVTQRERVEAEHRETLRSIGEPADGVIFGAEWDDLRGRRGLKDVRVSMLARHR